jgi:hypothetical protein
VIELERFCQSDSQQHILTHVTHSPGGQDGEIPMKKSEIIVKNKVLQTGAQMENTHHVHFSDNAQLHASQHLN